LGILEFLRRKPRVATESAQTGPSIRIPYTNPGLGAKYGEPITDADRSFAIKREPVAHRIVFSVAHDIFDNWFDIEDTAETPDENVDQAVQEAFSELNAKDVFTQMAIFERGYGWAIIVIGYEDKEESLKDPLDSPSKIDDLYAYGPEQISGVDWERDSNSERYGLPVVYKIIKSAGHAGRLHVHHSRVIHVATRLLEHPWQGVSVLHPVWDDLTNLRNIRWGMGQTLYRYGSGFPDITIEGAGKKQLDEFEASGAFANIHARTYFLHNEKQQIEFKGLAGRALNPEHYYMAIMENISAGSTVPLAILRGAQAGELAGSEVNEREYFKLISDAQSRYEPSLRFLIDKLIELGQIKTNVTDYKINWLGGFEINEKDKALTELSKAQATQLQTNWMTVNEIRAAQDPPLDEIEGGDLILGLLQKQTVPGSQVIKKEEKT